MRADCQVAIYVDVRGAMAEGVKFFRSDNNVVLTRGLGVARSLAPTGANSLYVAASSGLYEVDLEGEVVVGDQGVEHAPRQDDREHNDACS